MEIKIDDEFKSLIPPLTDEEYHQLEENILSEGIREKILVWNGTIIDGHNRYEIARKHNIPYEIEEKQFNCRDEAKKFMILNQFGRRNLNPFDRGRLALQYKPLIAKEAKENSMINLKQNTDMQKSAPRRTIGSTREELAKIAGISHDTIHKVEVIQEKAPETIKEQVKKGDLSINQAYILTKSAEEAKRKNEENERLYKEQLEKEREEREQKKRLEELEASLPKNTVMLEKFRKPEEKHIFGITDFNNLTEEQLEKCLNHAKKYNEAISKILNLYTSRDSLKAWECTMDSQEELELKLSHINSAVNVLLEIQNYFRGVKKIEKPKLNERS